MKKLLASVLAVAITAGCAVVGVSAQASPMGDVTLDGQVSIKDATTIQKACANIFELNGNQRKRADIDQNNKVNISDATALQRALVGQFEMPDLPADPLNNDDVKGYGNQAMADFGVKLLQERRKEDSNVLVSPLSVMSALGMAQSGARGTTLSQMEQTLGISRDTLNRYCKNYIESVAEPYERWDYSDFLDPKKKIVRKFSIANSAWFNSNMSPLSLSTDYTNTIKDYYNATVNTLPFDSSAKQKINGWVSENTDGMVPSIIDDISDDSMMYLVNALAFDGVWADRFDTEYDVDEGTFTNADNTKTTVEYLNSTEYNYIKDSNATGFYKIFGDYDYAFAAILPNKGTSLDDYVKSLTGSKVRSLLKNVKDEKTYIKLPKFRVEYGIEMSQTLQNMGMTNAFNATKADFSNMITSAPFKPYIGKVIHKTAIDVNETGTKAAAATAVEIIYGAAPEEVKPHEVYLTRPFVYMLINTKTHTPFFIGTMDDIRKAQ